MSIEAMKDALITLVFARGSIEDWGGYASEYFQNKHDLKGDISKVDKAITSLSQAIEQAEKQEPVAWLHTKIEGIAVPHRPADLDKHPDRWTALYPESKPCPTCEALARTVMMDQTAHDAQRKPLSNQKIIEMYNEPRSDAEMIEFARAIEAAHGIWPENSDCYGPDWTDRDGEYLK